MDPRCQWCGVFKKNRHGQCRSCGRFPVERQHGLNLTYSRVPGNEHLSSKLQRYVIKLDGTQIGTIEYDYKSKRTTLGPAWCAIYSLPDQTGGTVIHEKTFAKLLRDIRKTIEEAGNAT